MPDIFYHLSLASYDKYSGGGQAETSKYQAMGWEGSEIELYNKAADLASVKPELMFPNEARMEKLIIKFDRNLADKKTWFKVISNTEWRQIEIGKRQSGSET